jgi:signal transduction histidine kinase
MLAVKVQRTPLEILLVEDDPAEARRLVETLGEMPDVSFTLNAVGDLVAARRHLTDRAVEMVLLDLSLPGCEGTKAVTELRRGAPHVAIVVLASLDDEQIALDALARGAQDYVVKGQLDGPSLGRTIRSALQRKFVENALERPGDVAAQRRAIEELRDARRAAEAANRAKSDFLAKLSHEIRTPLGTIVGMADLLTETPPGPEYRECVEMLRRASQALFGLVNDVLDLSKIEAGRLELHRTAFSPLELMEAVVQLLRPAAEQKGIRLLSDLNAAVPPMIVGDAGRLRQILLNLISNAVKFTDEGRVMAGVRADSTPGVLLFTVDDTGIGIPPDKLASVFEDFEQLSASNDRERGGTGLGLGIARRLVELMGGRIWVESEPGRGSRFQFTIRFERPPLLAEVAAGSSTPTSASSSDVAAAPENARRRRILLADDSEDNRTLIRYYLKKLPYDLDFAEDGEAALRMFEAERYDLVLLDLQMPILDGYEAVRAMRRYEEKGRRSPTPIVALTAHAMDEKLQRCLREGCTAFVTKPVTRAQLVEVMEKHLSD